MVTKQKTERLTIANIVAIVGVVLLGVFSFLGRSYMSGGELSWDIVMSVAITAFTVFLLWFLIKAKGAENYLDNWKKAEFAALGIYIVFAIPVSLWGGIMHFFVVNDQKDSIKEYAKADLQKIDELFAEYKNFESVALSVTSTGLQNATGPGQVWDESLNKFMEQNNISHSRESAENFETIQDNLINSGFETIHNSFKAERNEIESVVNSWSVMQIPFKAKRIDELAESFGKKLSDLSHKAKLPVIIYGSDGKYKIDDDNQCRSFSVRGGLDSFEFKEHIKNASGFSATALLVVLLIHLLILFNYIVAYRTSTIAVGKGFEEDGGRILD